MKKLLLACMLAFGLTSNAQITLGGGSTTVAGTIPVPISSYYGYSWVQQIFTKSEITKLFCESGYEVQQYIGKDVGITELAKDMLDKLSQNLLINNSDDFMAYQWLVEACKKDDISDTDKKELVYLLRRLDNDINKEESLNKIRLFI